MPEPLAPIALFVYARPEHTAKTLESLKANTLAAQSELFIFADGPKSNADKETIDRITATRTLTKREQWCGKVHIIEADANMGLAGNIVAGVTRLCNEFGKVIVLEDDMVLAKGFLQYMNDALTMYKDDEKAMHVAGYMIPTTTKLPDTFFIHEMNCWGWATWQRAWKYYNPDAKYLYSEMEKLGFPADYNIHPANDYVGQLKANVDNNINTWAVKWLTTIYLKRGLCLTPGKSLVRNIGNDGTGLHCGFNELLLHQDIVDTVPVQRIEVKENRKAFNATKRYYERNQYNLKNRVARKVYQALGMQYY